MVEGRGEQRHHGLSNQYYHCHRLCFGCTFPAGLENIFVGYRVVCDTENALPGMDL